jgi:outer membrane protein insertion porin family
MRRIILFAVLTLCSLGTGRAQSPIREALRYEGERIAGIEYEPADQPLTRSELDYKLPFTVGSRFHERDLRVAIQNLFASGRFADLAVDATQEPEGVRLKFITKRAYFVGRVVVRGIKAPPNSGEITSAIKLRLGVPFAGVDAIRASESLRDLLRQNGFYHTRVTPNLSYDPQDEQANITFDVDTANRARYEMPEITGNPQRPLNSIIRSTHWKRVYGLLGWHEVTEARTRQGLDNLRRYYQTHSRLDSRVTLTRLQFLDGPNTVKPTIEIQAGSRITVRAVGARFSRAKLNSLVPIFQEHTFDPDLLVEGQRNIQQYLTAEGYFGSTVTFETNRDKRSGERVVIYNIDRGRRHKFVHLAVSGNHYFPTQIIRERLYMEPAQFPRFPYGRYSEAFLRQDVQSIQDLYTSNGFRDVKVTSRTEDDYRGARNRLALFINIEEGPQWFVSKLIIDGAPEAELGFLRLRLASLEGQPFSETSVAQDRETFLNYFYNLGYLKASFDYLVEPAGTPNQVNVRYVVQPGFRKYVRHVVVSGLETTRERLVNTRIHLKEGEPLSLTEQTESQRRLYELGIFARVNTAIQNPDGDEDHKNVLYDIDEARHYSLNLGVGAQIARIGGGVTVLDNPAGAAGFAPRFAFGVSRLNLLGLGQTLSLQTAISTIEQRAAVTYFVPQFVSNGRLNFTITTLAENTSDIRTFTAHRREGSIQLGQRLSRAFTIQYRLVFRHVTLSNLKIDQLLVPLLAQPETVGMTGVSIIQDKRDDPTDAHRGIYTTVDLAYAAGALGSQTQFARGLFRNSTYHPLRRDLIFARSTQFGIITRTGGRPSIPLAERLYSGGSTSIRAFPDFQAGPRDIQTGFPLGGNALLANSLELRFPLYGDNLAGVLFHDAGNVYRSSADISFRFRQRDLQDFNYMVQSAGFGLRYRTPIGPIRVDLSFSPNAPRFFGLKGTLQDYINGTAVPTVQKINAFQFHFSLGQAF